MTLAVHGLVVRLTGPCAFLSLMKKVKAHGTHSEVRTAQMLYDPKYGSPSTLEAFQREHSAYLLDYMARGWATAPGLKTEVVGLVVQKYADDDDEVKERW